MKILLAVDGSTCSDRAVEEVARRPWPEGSELKIISAMALPVIPSMEPYGLSPEYFAELKAGEGKRAQAAVDGALRRLRGVEDKTLELTGEIIEDAPKRAILEKADEWGADLIVVGSHGYGPLDRFLLGSVSSAVATHARCSVEIVRHRQDK